MNEDLVRRLHLALPQLRQWVDQLLAAHETEAQTLATFGFRRLTTCYPVHLLDRVRVVPTGRVPYPPVAQLGFPEFEPLQEGERLGITFLTTFFFLEGRATDTLFFHELVHVVQWSRLGFDRFMLAYAYGLSRFGYKDSPLERMAYSLEGQFQRGIPFTDLIGHIDHESDAIWRQAAPVVGPH
jgi:hypothetical protein